MLLRVGYYLSPSRAWNSPIFSSFTKLPLLLVYPNHHPILHSHSTLCTKSFNVNPFSMNGLTHLCTSAVLSATAKLPSYKSSRMSSRSKKKARRESPEGLLRHKLDMCSKQGNLVEALHLYDDARRNGVQLSQHHYNVLLYLCSSHGSSPDTAGVCGGAHDAAVLNSGLERGFEIFRQMGIDRVAPNEATFTSAARLAARMEDPEMAFDLVKQMKSYGILPKLRSYEPALLGFCKKGEADKAYEVDAHMAESGVVADEAGLSALLKLSADANKGNRVYEMLHRLRSTVRQVSESTATIVEDWFNSEAAVELGDENLDVGNVREGIAKRGGGWHGQGWLGSGKWNVVRTQIDEKGVCGSCGERLVCIDIDPLETEKFASSLTKLACQKEVMADFKEFQEWLQQHGPFDAIVDGANVGLINQQNFSFFQLNSVVNQLRQMSPSKRLPLIILHRGRVYGGPAKSPNNKNLLESWRKSGALYATPLGSNDDWYWLYAAVSCKCLLVTNDEMRDHLFQLLGTSFFPRWKEKHQVRLTFSRHGLALHMPPPYSIVTQESAKGSWHVPTVIGNDLETPRQWVCATRPWTLSSHSLSRLFS